MGLKIFLYFFILTLILIGSVFYLTMNPSLVLGIVLAVVMFILYLVVPILYVERED